MTVQSFSERGELSGHRLASVGQAAAAVALNSGALYESSMVKV